MQDIVQYHTLENSEIRCSYTLLLRVKSVFAILQTMWQDLVTIPRETFPQAFPAHRNDGITCPQELEANGGSNAGGIHNELVLCYTNEMTTVRSNHREPKIGTVKGREDTVTGVECNIIQMREFL